MLGFIIGLVVGAVNGAAIGVFAIAICSAGRDSDTQNK